MTQTIRKNPTGMPSYDRPWMQYYPQQLLNMIHIPATTLRQYMVSHAKSMDRVAINYYGKEWTYQELFDEADRVAKALRAIGFKKRDQIPCFFNMVPEFLPLLLGAEAIGASVLCRDNTLYENVEAVAKSGSKIMFAHTYLSQSDLDAFVITAGLEKVVLLDPMKGIDVENLPEHIKNRLQTYYKGTAATGAHTLSWEEFLAMGDAYEGVVEATVNLNRPLFRCYTSGSTGPSKQVIHSSNNMLSILAQMNFWAANTEIRPIWMTAALPPALIASVVAMLLLPLASDNLLYMSPFCDPEDVDLELMRIRPNTWAMVSMFCEVLMRSKRIPEDYDMSFLGSGAGPASESFNNQQLRRFQEFLKKHNCPSRVTCGYGCSEAGSNVTMPMSPKPYGNGMVNVPMPLSVVSIFKPGTTEELTYNQIGEICKWGPGNMLGYDDPEITAKTLRRHPDGNLWLHIGDLGYMDEDGVIHVVTRGESPRYGGGDLAIQPIENKVADAMIPGIDDEFFVVVPDKEHHSYFLPYMYVILEDGYTVDDIRPAVDAALADFERPLEIIPIDKRPFFHFKTNRLGLAKEILEKSYQE